MLTAVKEVLEAHPEVDLAYLFGSRAKGCSRADSDVDLGISARVSDLAGLKLQLLEELAAAGCERADITFFEQVTPFMRYEMIRHNHLLYCREGVSSGALFSRCLNEYLDLEPDLRVQREAYKRRVLHG